MVYNKIIEQWIPWFANNWIELMGVISALVVMLLTVARKWTVWIISIINSLFYIYINFNKKLYDMAGLCIYNAAISFYGLYCWKFAKTKNNQNLPFCFITKSLLLKLIPISIVIWVIVFFFSRFIISTSNLSRDKILFFFILETLITTLTIISAWMTARKIVESWLLWVIADIFSIMLYLHKEMYLTTFSYVVYAIFSISGYIFWRKQAIKNHDNTSLTKI